MGLYLYKLPDIGEGVVEAEITAWHVSIGDTVSEEDPIADAMTDKATIELTSPVDGVIKSVACEEGDILAVGAVLECISHADLDAYLMARIAPQNPGAPLSPNAKVSGQAPSPIPQSEAAQLLPGETRQKVIGLRRVIATRMQEAKRHIPHFTYVDEIDVTALEAMRQRMNANKSEDKPKLTVLPLMIRALAVTLEDWPQFNARYMDVEGYVSQFEDLNLGIATQTDNGVIVPVIKRANRLSVWELAEEIARLAEAARTHTLGTADLEGATTTLTSLGPLGGIVTTPVINRPEVAIFGPNKIRETLVVEAGEILARKVMNFSISCDHRVIDGYDAAKMIQDLKARLEDPRSIFIL